MRAGRGGTHPRRHFFMSYGMLHIEMTTEAPPARRVHPLFLWCLQHSLVSTFVPVSYENTMKTSRQAVAGAPERRGRASEVRRWSRTSSLCVPSADSGQTPANTQRTVVETVSIPTHVARSQKAPSSLLPGTFIMYIPLVIVGHRQTP